MLGGFFDSPVVRTQSLHYRGPGSIPGQGTKILLRCVAWPKKKKKKNSLVGKKMAGYKNLCNKSPLLIKNYKYIKANRMHSKMLTVVVSGWKSFSLLISSFPNFLQ